MPNEREARRRDFNAEHPERAGVTVGEDLADRALALAFELQAAESTREAAEAEVERLRAIIDRPDPHDFIEASAIEAKFQMDRWGTTEGFPTAFDGQEDHHFVYLIAYLVGKVAATPDDDPEKKLHRITTIAAAAANWHIVARAALSPREDSER